MNLKTFRANTMADALALVKKDLGRDAVILSTRSLRIGGFLGFGGKGVIEITASDQGKHFERKEAGTGAGNGGGRDSRRGGTGNAAGNGMAAGGSGELSDSGSWPAMRGHAAATNAYRQTAGVGAGVREGAAPAAMFIPAPEPKPDPLAGMLLKSVGGMGAAIAMGNGGGMGGASAVAEVREVNVSRELPVRNTRLPATATPFAPVDASASAQIRRELHDIKLLVNQVLQASPVGSGGNAGGANGGGGSGNFGMPETLFRQYLKLLESRVAREIADGVIGAVRDELTPGELADESIVRTSVLRHIAALLPADQSVTRPGKGANGRPFVMAMVGPTGVGKTTTVAKLAAAFKLRHGRSVALITSDTYRIAAVDQLRTYASIIGLPLKVVLTPEEMTAAIAELGAAGHDLILVDTAGRSQHNADRIGELSAFLEAARADQTHLVLSSAACESVLVRTAHAFAATRPNHILFTKLDEAVNFGVLVNVVHRVGRELGIGSDAAGFGGTAGLPLSFVTMGQEVPDHIEPGRSDKLARAVLDNRLYADERANTGHGAPPGSVGERAETVGVVNGGGR